METSIQTVTVFPDRARVLRVGKCELTTGEHWLTLENLPLALIDDSIRARGQGTARAQLLGVSVRRSFFQETPAAEARELEQQIQTLQTELARSNAHVNILEQENESLAGIANQSDVFARGLTLRGQSTTDQIAIFDFLRQRRLATQGDILQLQTAEKATQQQIQVLQNRLQQIQATRPTERNQVQLQVVVSSPGTLEIELTYMVLGAYWQPSYDLRVQGETVAVNYLAEVQQNTGEDWADVQLVLSTAQPALALKTPDLSPWWVQQATPPAVPRSKMMPQAMMMRTAGGASEESLLAMPAAAPAPDMADLEQVSANVAESGPALTYQLAGKATIPSAVGQRKVTIAQLNWQAKLDYVCAPKLAAACYRRAQVTNDSPYTLLPGTALLFVGDDYMGNVALKLAVPKQEIEVYLGADERVAVKRTEVVHDVDKNLLGDKRRTRFGYQIQLDNLTGSPQKVLVRDQMPLSRSEQIKIRLENAEPRPTEQTDLGYLTWQLTLPTGGSQKLRFEFSVEHPRQLEINGLP
jgi:uncharacterized protein (TIGR02231 family)